MAGITVTQTGIDDLVIIEPTVFGDERGYFMETYNRQVFEEAGLNMTFVQDNESCSRKGVLRGLHFQTQNVQGKLVRVTEGAVWDVAVDLRKESKTFGEWVGITLSAENKKMFYVPEGFAHGFVVLSDMATFTYKCTNFYAPEFDGGIRYDDPDIGIQWPTQEIETLLLSDKDRQLPFLKEVADHLPF
ncbi:MAG: dTDP-4-dehydrorhamnose 3,5-epimerase [Eubacteriaceae bacterium]|jgi:dTDP-4-dehydrorhamnose 3,5-epimerase|nr:dTDP-4-dehydrorhamnose 3,5-epimerase [Eubacteriaceae bacterium]